MATTEIVIALYNVPEYEARTIEAVARNTDGARTPYSLSALRNKRGRGLAAFWNSVIDRSEADLICLLNSDTVPARGWLEKMQRRIGDGVGCVVPSSNNVAESQIDLSRTGLRHDERSIDVINDFAAGLVGLGTVDLQVASAMCLLFSREVWERAGRFDEDFFLYGEDSEFTERVRKLGLRLVWARDAYVHHYKGQSVARAVADGEFDYDEVRARASRLFLEKTGRV
jgi:GT2 family glycosyltransferase